MHPDLVRATGLEVDLEQAREPVGLEGLVVGDAVSAVAHHRELVVVVRVAPDRRVDRSAQRVRVALDQRVVGLVDGAVTEGVLEHGVGMLGLADHHHAARADVEALHDPLSLAGTAGGDPEPGTGQVAHHGRAGPARRGVDGHADRLVDHHDGVVVVDDPDPLDDLGDHRERVGLERDRHIEHRAAVDPVALADSSAVDLHEPLGDQVGGLRTGEAEHPGHRGVDSLTGEAVGNEDGALLGTSGHRRLLTRWSHHGSR